MDGGGQRRLSTTLPLPLLCLTTACLSVPQPPPRNSYTRVYTLLLAAAACSRQSCLRRRRRGWSLVDSASPPYPSPRRQKHIHGETDPHAPIVCAGLLAPELPSPVP